MPADQEEEDVGRGSTSSSLSPSPPDPSRRVDARSVVAPVGSGAASAMTSITPSLNPPSVCPTSASLTSPRPASPPPAPPLRLRHLGRLRQAAGRAGPPREAEEAEQARAAPGAGRAGARLGNSGPPPGAPVAEVLDDAWVSPDELAYVVRVVDAASWLRALDAFE